MSTLDDDARLARLVVTIRRRVGVTQEALADRTGVPRRDIVRIEAGRAGLVRLDRVRTVLDGIGGRARLGVWWKGAAADRLLDEAHAALVERAVTVFRRRGWTAFPEISFSEFGERGSIDILGARVTELAVAISEVKSEFGSLEETNRTLDAKARLAPVIAERVLGWRPKVVGRILIVPDRMTLRRVVERHAQTMNAIYPARSREVRAWLRSPVEPLRGIWFLSSGRQANDGAE